MCFRSPGVVAALVLAAPVLADPAKTSPTDDAREARARLTEYLKSIPGTESARVTPLAAEDITATFPNHVLFAVLFPQYPVARIAPPPLKSSNVVAIPKKNEGKPVPITDVKELEAFFKAHARTVKPGVEADAAMQAWLRAAAELNQDGFYRFSFKTGPGTASGNTITTSGEAPVDPKGGDKGQIKASLIFKDGKLAKAETKAMLTPGIRPICQATKLLDPDPIVRGMAEQSIRVMGSAAKPYLEEQRAKAGPELRQAIDRIWEQIQKEGR